jgi:hypothetical protein
VRRDIRSVRFAVPDGPNLLRAHPHCHPPRGWVDHSTEYMYAHQRDGDGGSAVPRMWRHVKDPGRNARTWTLPESDATINPSPGGDFSDSDRQRPRARQRRPAPPRLRRARHYEFVYCLFHGARCCPYVVVRWLYCRLKRVAELSNTGSSRQWIETLRPLPTSWTPSAFAHAFGRGPRRLAFLFSAARAFVLRGAARRAPEKAHTECDVTRLLLVEQPSTRRITWLPSVDACGTPHLTSRNGNIPLERTAVRRCL